MASLYEIDNAIANFVPEVDEPDTWHYTEDMNGEGAIQD